MVLRMYGALDEWMNTWSSMIIRHEFPAGFYHEVVKWPLANYKFSEFYFPFLPGSIFWALYLFLPHCRQPLGTTGTNSLWDDGMVTSASFLDNSSLRARCSCPFQNLLLSSSTGPMSSDVQALVVSQFPFFGNKGLWVIPCEVRHPVSPPHRTVSNNISSSNQFKKKKKVKTKFQQDPGLSYFTMNSISLTGHWTTFNWTFVSSWNPFVRVFRAMSDLP